MGAPAGSLDVADLGRGVARGWRAVLVGTVLGLAAGGAWVAFGPQRYAGVATVLVRNANDPTGSILSRFGIAGEVAAGAGGGALGTVLKSPLETEIKILGSRDILGAVVDSLRLQARVVQPRGVAPGRLVAAASYEPSFRRRTVRFTRRPDGTYVGEGVERSVIPGGTAAVGGVGRVTLAPGPLPPEFALTFEDREDAITRLAGKLDVSKQGGELVELDYTGPDSATAADVPNVVIDVYLQRRRTVDRGQNARRLEFLVAKADSAAVALRQAEGALRADQESSRVLDPELSGKAGIEAVGELRQRQSQVEAERASLGQLVRQADAGTLGARQLAAFPSLLRAPAVNSILSQLTTLETERTRLRERRTERDPELLALTTSINELEAQLLPLARTYAGSLDREAATLGAERGVLESRLDALPRQAESAFRRQRDVRLLSQTVLGLQAQILDARLAAIAEGGQVRAVDAAVPAKRQRFPRPTVVILAGVVLGALLGILAALMRSALGRRVDSAGDAERAGGLPAFRLGGANPDALVLGPLVGGGTLLVVPADYAALAAARRVAAACAALALEHGHRVVRVEAEVRDVGVGPATGAGTGSTLSERVAAAETQADCCVVGTPPLADVRALALLGPARYVLVVAAAGKTSRASIVRAADALARAGAPVLGIAVVRAGWDGTWAGAGEPHAAADETTALARTGNGNGVRPSAPAAAL